MGYTQAGCKAAGQAPAAPPRRRHIRLRSQGRYQLEVCGIDAYPIAKHVVVQSLPSLQPDPFLWVFIREEQPKIIG